MAVAIIVAVILLSKKFFHDDEDSTTRDAQISVLHSSDAPPQYDAIDDTKGHQTTDAAIRSVDYGSCPAPASENLSVKKKSKFGFAVLNKQRQSPGHFEHYSLRSA